MKPILPRDELSGWRVWRFLFAVNAVVMPVVGFLFAWVVLEASPWQRAWLGLSGSYSAMIVTACLLLAVLAGVISRYSHRRMRELQARQRRLKSLDN